VYTRMNPTQSEEYNRESQLMFALLEATDSDRGDSKKRSRRENPLNFAAVLPTLTRLRLLVSIGLRTASADHSACATINPGTTQSDTPKLLVTMLRIPAKRNSCLCRLCSLSSTQSAKRKKLLSFLILRHAWMLSRCLFLQFANVCLS
jgi:hypothetical protein